MISAIVLAAGASSRMGSPKALLPIRGRPAVEVVVATLREGGVSDVVVVLGCHAIEIRAGADLRAARVVENARWAKGRTSSIQCGLAALPAQTDWALLALVDMPLVKAATIRSLVAATQTDAEVVVPVHNVARGHPVALRRSLFPRIAELGPDVPLRDLLRTVRGDEIDVPDGGVAFDLDTPDDVARL